MQFIGVDVIPYKVNINGQAWTSQQCQCAPADKGQA